MLPIYTLRSPEPGTPDGGAPPATEPPRTFTQEDFDRAIGKVRAEATKPFADYAALKEKVARLAEAEERAATLATQLEESGKTADEKQRLAGERASKVIERERAAALEGKLAAEAERDAIKNRYVSEKLAFSIGRGLDTAKVLSEAREDAVLAFRSAAKIEHDDEGSISSVEYDGIAYKDVASAAAAFLKSKPYLASAGRLPVGGGTNRPTAGGQSGQSLSSMTAAEAFGRAFSDK